MEMEKTMQIHNRQKEIIYILLHRTIPIHGTDLAKLISSSTRTIRQDVSTINTLLLRDHKIKIHSNSNKGYWIKEEDKHAFICFSNQIIEEITPTNQNQREIFICFYLLEHDNEFTSMGVLADLCFVSKTTISNTIKNVSEIVQAAKGLELTVSTKKGLQLSGTEFSKRNLYSSVILLFYEIEREYMNRYIQRVYDTLHVTQSLHILLMNYFTNHKILLTSKSLSITMNEILIIIYRIKTLHKSIESKHDKSSISLPFKEIETLVDVKLSESEKVYFKNVLKKKRSYSEHVSEASLVNHSNKIIQEYYSYMKLNYNLDFYQEEKLTEHINTMLYFHDTLIHLDYNSFNKTKENYPFAFQLALHMNAIITNYTYKELNEAELDSLTARMAVILDRNIGKMKTIIVTNQSTSLTELLETRLQLFFGQFLLIMNIYPSYQVSSIDEIASFDVIITTSREITITNKNVLYVSPFLDHDDMLRIISFIKTRVPSYGGYPGS